MIHLQQTDSIGLSSVCGWLKSEQKINISSRTVVRYLHEHDYNRRIPRPVPEPPDKGLWVQQQKEFIPKLLNPLSDPQVEVFRGDESGFEGDPRPRQRWVKRGSRPTQGYYGGHVRAIVVGAVDLTNPDLNTMERPWQYFKSHHMAGFITNDGQLLKYKLTEPIQEKMEIESWYSCRDSNPDRRFR